MAQLDLCRIWAVCSTPVPWSADNESCCRTESGTCNPALWNLLGPPPAVNPRAYLLGNVSQTPFPRPRAHPEPPRVQPPHQCVWHAAPGPRGCGGSFPQGTSGTGDKAGREGPAEGDLSWLPRRGCCWSPGALCPWLSGQLSPAWGHGASPRVAGGPGWECDSHSWRMQRVPATPASTGPGRTRLIKPVCCLV